MTIAYPFEILCNLLRVSQKHPCFLFVSLKSRGFLLFDFQFDICTGHALMTANLKVECFIQYKDSSLFFIFIYLYSLLQRESHVSFFLPPLRALLKLYFYHQAFCIAHRNLDSLDKAVHFVYSLIISLPP